MRIGELAALVGVSTRTVRHYHHLGLLPEPRRLPNGYRTYGLRDAVALARIRRLAELGMSLEEIRDVLADDRGRELREVLEELDADLARQQEEIAARRARLAELLAKAELGPDATVSPGMAEVLRALPAPELRIVEIDREILRLVDSVAEPAARDRMLGLMRSLLTPATLARGHAFYERMDQLADADPEDPRLRELAAEMVAHLPQEVIAELAVHMPGSPPATEPRAKGDEDGAGSAAEREPAWLRVLLEELSPAQAEVLRQMVIMMGERARC